MPVNKEIKMKIIQSRKFSTVQMSERQEEYKEQIIKSTLVRYFALASKEPFLHSSSR